LFPPFTGIAENVTDCPWHAGFADAAIMTLEGMDELTTIVIGLEVAGFPVTQFETEVSWQVTMSPSAGE
jgi:hypothetical protein